MPHRTKIRTGLLFLLAVAFVVFPLQQAYALMGETPEANDWAALSRAVFDRVLATYSDDGYYYEGMEYWNLNKATRLRANVSVVFSEKVTFDASTGYIRGFTRFGQPARADGGVWEDLIWGNGYCAPRINNKNACPRLFIYQEHLPTDIARVEATRDYQRFTGSGALNFTPTEWLTTRAIVGIDEGWDENTALYPLEVVEPVFFRMPIGEITVGGE